MPPVNGAFKSSKMHSKVVIIGSGPAGHTAAIYLARANLEPVMFEGFMANGFAAGGQLTTTTDVENFPGFPDGVRGPEMMDKFRAQSIRFGTKIITETISKIDLSERPFKYWREGEEGEPPETTETVIIATGASAKRMGLKGEDTYWQSGISACASRQKPLAVIGGGDSAAEEATYLTKYGSHVYVLVRRDELRASAIMAKRLKANPKVTILWNTVATECLGDGDLLNSLRIKNVKTGEEKLLPVSGLFYAIGHEPATELVRSQITTDADGYIITVPGTTQTNVKGVFAAGDVQDKRYRQAITSAGSGCMAALEAESLRLNNFAAANFTFTLLSINIYYSAIVMSELCPVYAPFFGAMGCTSAIVFTCIGASYGTAKSGVGISAMSVLRPDLMMKCVVPVIMAGIIAIYGLVVSVLISGNLQYQMPLYTGFVQLGAGLSVGLAGLAAGFAIGIVGDAGVRGTAQQPRLFVGMILILIFAEVLGLYGLIVALIMNTTASGVPAGIVCQASFGS
ncbi:hypothetical protein JB92DRAFT_2829708 [Gautieria morchelliformis]|nr:hypothetical protein JB92DRAFT_2829708 [Gautieria morchelliformis]